MNEDVPERGDIVICKITKVMDYGVFAELLEYDNQKGFVHISEVASRWVKNIRNFAKEGQMRAAKVIAISPEKNQIDLSLTKVSPNIQRLKIEEYKQLIRNTRLIELLATNEKKEFDDAWDAVAEPLIKEYETLYDAFQKIATEKENAIKMIPKEWQKPLLDLVEKNVSISMKTVKGVFTLQSTAPNGVEKIKSTLSKAEKSTKDAHIDIYYSGSGKYVIKVSSPDYKVAERVLKYVSGLVVDDFKSGKAIAEFERAN
ncbi:MAG: translation initiation factor IF-2 subunit alpha [Candidatus Diapherotrites archaeon]